MKKCAKFGEDILRSSRLKLGDVGVFISIFLTVQGDHKGLARKSGVIFMIFCFRTKNKI